MASRFVDVKENQRQTQTRSITPNAERLARAASAKVSSKDKLFSSRKSTPPISDNTPSRYSNRDSFPDPYSVPEPYYEQHAQPHHQQLPSNSRGVFDETLTSGFEDTASDVPAATNFVAQLRAQDQRQQELHGGNAYFHDQEGGAYYGDSNRVYDDEDEGDYSDEDATRHTHIGMQAAANPLQPQLNLKPNQKPLRHEHQQEDLRRTSDIAGRFQPALQANLELRQVQDTPYEEKFMTTQRKGSKKRQQSEPSSNQQQRHQEDYHSMSSGKVTNDAKAQEAAEESLMEEEDEVETPDPDRSPVRRRQDENRFSRSSQIDHRLYPDYSDKDLKSMSFADLKRESWDTVPGQAESDRVPEELKGADVTLNQKLEYYAHNENPYCSEFFENLSTPEWEESGDMILKKMMALTQQIIASRERKREIMAEYEAKYETRERAVREKSDSYDAKLNQMKNSGQTVLRRKKA
ncbi:extracellular mutant protein 11-domain-containing protein [Tricladium varicosporioides]|nr:extracellular mutant protein 11-domain-containing protein [Hymenoscyphus varicosporioides]